MPDIVDKCGRVHVRGDLYVFILRNGVHGFHMAKPAIIDPGLYMDLFWIPQHRSFPTTFNLFTGFHMAKTVIIDTGLYVDVFWKPQRRSVPTAFKLFTGLQIQKQHKIITPGAAVLDLGCAPDA
ncbi:hypothetical protein ACQJBY_025253 [Aegilops geniculata]